MMAEKWYNGMCLTPVNKRKQSGSMDPDFTVLGCCCGR